MKEKKDSKDRSQSDLFTKLKTALRSYQVGRLRNTYADLLASSQYREICEFFFTDIYGTQDFSRRNRAFIKLSYFLKDAMGARIFSGIEMLIELNELTEILDDRMVEVLLGMGVSEQFSDEQYEQAYRKCDNYEERVRQISLTVTSTTFMHGMSKLHAIGFIIKGVRLAAIFIGVGEVMSFLERGYSAFSSVEDIDTFTSIIEEREMTRLNQIYEE